MTTYNGQNWVKEQFTSIINQREVDVTVWVADDASSDNTVSILTKCVRGQDVILVRSSPTGSAGGNFLRLFLDVEHICSGFDYVAFCDQDDIWLDNKLLLTISELNRNKGDGASSSVEAFWDDGRRVILSQNPKIRKFDFLFEGAGQGCSFLLRADKFKQCLEIIRLHRESLNGIHYHDWLVYFLFRVLNFKWVFVDQSTMLYRQHSGNDTGAKVSLSGVFSRLRLLFNGWYASQVYIYLCLYKLIAGNKQPQIGAMYSYMTGEGTFSDYFKTFNLISFLSRRKFSERALLVIVFLLGKFKVKL